MFDEESDTSRTAEDQDQPQDMEAGTGPGGEEPTAERGADSPEATEQQSDFDKEMDEAKEEVRQLEEEPPAKLEDWPTGKAKYETFGGPEGEHGYHEGPEQKLGPSALRHRDDGSVEVEGEKVDDPDEFKAEPVPGGPTDPNTPNLRMDKASPDDVSDVARKAAGEERSGEEGGGEERSGEEGGGEERGGEDES